MIDETYIALANCARSRIAQEWQCHGAERDLLALIVELSFALGQSWAVVPCLADFAEACSMHKSTASRALRAAVAKGHLEILQRQGETLYRICTETKAEPDPQARAKQQTARERLVKLNQARFQGTADADGQGRIPGVFESEEMEAPAAAFDAITEAENVPRGTKHLVSPAVSVVESKLESLMRTMNSRRDPEAVPPGARPGGGMPTSVPPPPVTSRMEVGNVDSQWQEMTRGLSDQAIHCLEMIREECRHRKGGMAEFFQWSLKWRQRASQHTRLYLEAAAVHKSMRLESGTIAKSPGAFIYMSVKTALSPPT